MIEQFIRSFRRPPKKPLYLDFDATDDRVHGQQLGRHFNGYYNHYIFLPLFVFCGDQLLVSYLRPASLDAAHHAGAILALLVRRLRQAWPEVKIVFRGDSGFCRPLILNWCDRHGVDYIIGLAGNKRLAKLALDIDYTSAIRFEKSWEKERVFVFSDRTSCHEWWPNQYRLLLSGLAYLLLERLRRIYLKRTAFAQAQVNTLRLKLLKIGAVITRNTRTIRLMLSSQYPEQDLFLKLASKLVPG